MFLKTEVPSLSKENWFKGQENFIQTLVELTSQVPEKNLDNEGFIEGVQQNFQQDDHVSQLSYDIQSLDHDPDQGESDVVGISPCPDKMKYEHAMTK